MGKKLWRSLLSAGFMLAATNVNGAQMPTWSYSGSSFYEELGWRVLGCGDINGDSINDFVASAPGFDSDRGHVYAFSGHSPFQLLFLYVGENSGDAFGKSIGAGDFDGDGISDVLVGSPMYNSSQGRAYLFRGRTPASSPETVQAASADVIISGSNLFGQATAITGDMNGDGRRELLITNVLTAYVFVGRNLNGQLLLTSQGADRIHTEPDGYGAYGWAVADLGDITANGRTDYAVTDYRYPPDSVNDQIGRVWLYRDDGQLITKITGETAADYFGWSVASAGDLNADGVPDILVGAVTYEPESPLGMGRGKAYAFSGASPTTLLVAHEGKEPATYPPDYVDRMDFWGSSVAGGGDFDGDGTPDLLVVGDSHRSDVITDTGTVYVFSGLTGLELLRIYGSPRVLPSGPHQNWGLWAAFVNDINNDGDDDILVGSHHDDEIVTHGGRIDIYVSDCCVGRRGNVDCDPQGTCDISDLQALGDYLFYGGTLCCEEQADIDDSGTVDIADYTYLADYLFNNGQPPSTCSASN
ncbi:MAG: FG-GAP-like repeat-containing protein [Candidatus Zixiibacteriota bacterium]